VDIRKSPYVAHDTDVGILVWGSRSWTDDNRREMVKVETEFTDGEIVILENVNVATRYRFCAQGCETKMRTLVVSGHCTE